jgi:hypothetical protein
MLMSSAYDTDPNAIYCMIEVLSVNNTDGFEEFSGKMAKFWMDNFQARYINLTHDGGTGRICLKEKQTFKFRQILTTRNVL